MLTWWSWCLVTLVRPWEKPYAHQNICSRCFRFLIFSPIKEFQLGSQENLSHMLWVHWRSTTGNCINWHPFTSIHCTNICRMVWKQCIETTAHSWLYTYNVAKQRLTVNSLSNFSEKVPQTTDHTTCLHFYLNYPAHKSHPCR